MYEADGMPGSDDLQSLLRASSKLPRRQSMPSPKRVSCSVSRLGASGGSGGRPSTLGSTRGPLQPNHNHPKTLQLKPAPARPFHEPQAAACKTTHRRSVLNKITANDPEARSADLVAENIERLKSLFPEAVTDGRINFEVLRQLLGEALDEGDEKYGLNWHGKRLARQVALTPSSGTLRPCLDGSVDWDRTHNLMIEGDNLEVLKLLQKSYAGKVKLIYIDPPYNTGNEFIYSDDFKDNVSHYLEMTRQIDANRRLLSSNTDASGRFHTAWLNMMYPRLKVAWRLLKEDGCIFISIDDHEVSRLRTICDEIFGEENFIATVIWQKVYSPKNSARHFSVDHDYLLAYARNADTWRPNLLPRSEEADARYTNIDDDPRGPWKPSDLTARNYYSRGRYEVVGPTGKTFTSGVGRYWLAIP